MMANKINTGSLSIENKEIKSGESCIRNTADVKKINKCIGLLNETSMSISEIAKTLNLVGNETRLKLLYLIFKVKDICVCDLSDALGISVSAISQQLKKLKDGNLIIDEKRGKTIYYSINEDRLESLLGIFLQISRNKLDELL